MRAGIVFAGQGAQYPGMGQDLCEHSAAAKEIFEAAGEQVRNWCFHGTKEMLRQTNITQPSIYTVTMAAYRALQEALDAHAELSEQLEIIGYAGFSLGEYAALTAAGSIRDIADGQDIVTRRGHFMNEAGKDADGNQRGGMAAAFGRREDICAAIEAVRGDDILTAANFNSPIQTVAAGEKPALQRFVDHAGECGLKAKMLSVSTAFHSPMMEPAAAQLEQLLRQKDLQAPRQKIYSNTTARDLMEDFDGGSTGGYLAERMARQAMRPVYWQETIENMIADGAQVFIEVGPGRTLSGLIRKIRHGMPTLHVEDSESLAKTIEQLEKQLHEGEVR
ncbi:MAG: ACP S-malonyltransferase [Anaerovoracaceae bacterium]|jgi:[acyl-carrier-protein] S-malonyltransferase